MPPLCRSAPPSTLSNSYASAPSHHDARYHSPVQSRSPLAPTLPTSSVQSVHSGRSSHISRSPSNAGTEPRNRFSSQHSSPVHRPSWQHPVTQYAYPPLPPPWYAQKYISPPPPYAIQWQPCEPRPKRSHHHPPSTTYRRPASPPLTASMTEPNSPSRSETQDSPSEGEDRSPLHNSSSSPDEAVTPEAPPSGDDSRKFHDLFKRVALAQERDLEKVQVKQYKLLRTLESSTTSRLAIPRDEAIMDPAENIWQTPASIPPTNKKADRKYFIAPKDTDFLFTHLPPNSLVVDSVRHKGRQPNLKRIHRIEITRE
nr:leucine-rich repeat extensin-like protein 3 [Pelodiscus sinensis]|eukprot:XP_025041533.1 leucine-rich repeat extensin-like protein 3 [Pelodiscus sinensis]